MPRDVGYQKLLERLKHITESLGLEVAVCSNLCGMGTDLVLYRPHTIHINIDFEDMSWATAAYRHQVATYLAHELGHWLAASPPDRRRRDYGISRMSVASAEMIEAKALVIAKEILHRAGAPNKAKNQHDADGAYGDQAREWWKKTGNAYVTEMLGKKRWR